MRFEWHKIAKLTQEEFQTAHALWRERAKWPMKFELTYLAAEASCLLEWLRVDDRFWANFNSTLPLLPWGAHMHMRNESLLCTGTIKGLSYCENLVSLWISFSKISVTHNCHYLHTKTHAEKISHCARDWNFTETPPCIRPYFFSKCHIDNLIDYRDISIDVVSEQTKKWKVTPKPICLPTTVGTHK